MVITPDCYTAIDQFRALEKLDIIENSIEGKHKDYIIKLVKLFSKASKPAQQIKTLSKGLGKKETKKLVNVYFGTPNRLLKLIEMKGISVTKTLRHIVVHCKQNKKKFTIFDIKDTKNDLHLLLAALKPYLDTTKKTKVMLCP